MKLNYKKTIFVAGHNGLVGSSFIRLINANKKFKILTADRKKVNLEKQENVKKFFKKNKPDYVINAAALAGGIYANDKYCADFIERNLAIQHNIIKACHDYRIKKLLFLGSSCIYPKFCKQPMKEEYLLNGYLEKTNEAYAIAKIAGLKMCSYYNKQYKTDFRVVMPTNIYGINDKYDFHNSHVIPALLLKFHTAKKLNKKIVDVWGSGKAKREFIFADDVAKISLNILLKSKKEYDLILKKKKIEFLNVGSTHELSIKALSKKIKKIVGFNGKIKFKKNMKEGTPRKLLDITNTKKFLKNHYHITDFEKGLKIAYNDFLKRYG